MAGMAVNGKAVILFIISLVTKGCNYLSGVKKLVDKEMQITY
jgi:hypothetical protein